jgi:hypothetical protein
MSQHLFAWVADEQLVRIWQAVVRGDKDALLQRPWKPLSDLPPYVRDYYRSGRETPPLKKRCQE